MKMLRLLAIVALVTALPASAAPSDRHGSGEVVQEFTFRGAPATAWKVRYEFARAEGLAITGAWFRRAPGEAGIQGVGGLRPAEMFVPDHVGDPRPFQLD